MAIYQGTDRRKITGGKKNSYRGKRKYELGRPFTETTLAQESQVIKVRGRGGNIKMKVRYAAYANVFNPSTGKSSKVKVTGVLETPANREYARRGIIVKGTKIKTEAGVAIVTSRPGQDGVINATLVSQ